MQGLRIVLHLRPRSTHKVTNIRQFSSFQPRLPTGWHGNIERKSGEVLLMKGWKPQSRGFTTAQAYSHRCRRLPECSWRLVKWLMCVDLCALCLHALLTFHQRVSSNRTDLEQLGVKLQSILSIISKYRENGGLRALDYRVEKFCLYECLFFCPCLFDAPESRAINLEIDAVEKLYGNSLWTRTLEGTKDADTVLKAFRNISSLCDVFQVSFSHHGQGCVCTLIASQRSIPSYILK